MKQQFKALLIAIRPEHWIKNSFVFTALVFSGRFLNLDRYLPASLAFGAFCLASSGAYLFNDVLDFSQDQQHPRKKDRPIAAGQLSRKLAVAVGIILSLAALAMAFSVNRATCATVLAYCLLTLAYSAGLKSIPMLDSGIIALGFVLRAYGGALAIKVYPSPWLIVCSFLLAAFLALAKRLHELESLGIDGKSHRKSLKFYTRGNLLVMIYGCVAAIVVLYAVYTLQPSTVRQVKGPGLILTLPYVIYGISRYLYLIHHQNGGGRPVQTFLTDWKILLTVAAWGVSSAIIIFLNR